MADPSRWMGSPAKNRQGYGRVSPAKASPKKQTTAAKALDQNQSTTVQAGKATEVVDERAFNVLPLLVLSQPTEGEGKVPKVIFLSNVTQKSKPTEGSKDNIGKHQIKNNLNTSQLPHT